MNDDTQNEDIFKEWLTARREETDGLDIRKNVQLELENSPVFKENRRSAPPHSSILSIPNLFLSTLVRVGATAAWFLFNT